MGQKSAFRKRMDTDAPPVGFFQLPNAYDDVDHIVNKIYLENLENYPVIPFQGDAPDISETACFFPIVRIVVDQKEDILQKLSSVYASAGSADASLTMVIRGYVSGEAELYLGVCCEESRINGAYPKARVLYDSFIGHFPGCKDARSMILDAEDTRVLLNKCYAPEYGAVAAVSCIASLRDERHGQNAGFYQGIDKVIETMAGSDYSIVILACPLPPSEVEAVRLELEDLYTRLFACAKVQIGLNWSEATSVSQALTKTISESVSRSDSRSLNIGVGASHTRGKGVYGGVSVGGNGLGVGGGISRSKSDTDSTSVGRAVSEAISKANVASSGNTESRSDTQTSGESTQVTLENKRIIETLARIDEQLKRIRKGKGIGMFAGAAYFLAKSPIQARIAASAYKAVVSGSDTNLENSGLNLWTGSEYKHILSYLRLFRHPCFNLKHREKTAGKVENDENFRKVITATPAVMTTSQELAVMMGLPRNKLSGIPFRESITFERSVFRMDNSHSSENLKLGRVYYLGHEEKNEVFLNLDDLTKHSLITGSTGSGKSNASYWILTHLPKSIPFLVIEPAKGEYKDAIQSDVKVYGTNPYHTPVLRINPFRFCRKNRGVHILEHLDRMTAIFNVCWPMEAAMPAVLKQALERAYIASGWDLRRSRNSSSELILPTFEDVMREVENIMEESNYSEENKGNYIGALCTRLRDLTVGINGMVFSAEDLTDEELFDSNVIVDLSRVGSTETKALIMGLLMIRMQEYRECTRERANSSIRHITVLEEAHHLLRRTSMEQSADGVNLMGRSVEMLSNAFAEMRTYGEGFIILDQSPEQLDKSVIRNTNTKIVLRLPDYGDRKLVGKAMGMNEEQIGELSRLPVGVAAVYQNNWLGSVLVKIPEAELPKTPYSYEADEDAIFDSEREDTLYRALSSVRIEEFELWLSGLGEKAFYVIAGLSIPTKLKRAIFDYLSDDIKDEADMGFSNEIYSYVVYEFYHAESAFRRAISKRADEAEPSRMEDFETDVIKGLNPSPAPDVPEDLLYQLLLFEYHKQNGGLERLVERVVDVPEMESVL